MQTILSMWTWHPSIIIGCAGLAIGYLAWAKFRPGWKLVLFLSGVLVILFTLVSPLDALGDTYLFSAHMLQHELLILAAPPLLLLGLPAGPTEKVLGIKPVARVERVLGSPPAAWLAGVGAIWIWHLPALYNAALANENVHLLEHLTFLVTSVIFWWPVLAPLESRRMSLLGRAAYLILASVACDTLGILLAYAPVGIYPAYLQPVDTYGVLPLLRDQWRITPSADQQAGGLLMGLTTDPLYLLIAFSALSKWHRQRQQHSGA